MMMVSNRFICSTGGSSESVSGLGFGLGFGSLFPRAVGSLSLLWSRWSID